MKVFFNLFQVLAVGLGFSGEILPGPNNKNMVCVVGRCHTFPVGYIKTILSAVSYLSILAVNLHLLLPMLTPA